MNSLIEVLLNTGEKIFAKTPENIKLKKNDFVVLKRDFYIDCGKVNQIFEKPIELDQHSAEHLGIVQRVASKHDIAHYEISKEKAVSAYKTAKKIINDLKLEMKLLDAHTSLDGKLVKFHFTADGRVDFRELVKQLSSALSTRIELRQIGVRDETALVGGIGVCGRNLCCADYIREFASINVKIAKDQDLSLTPSTISGVCGRLKCCLNYESEGYEELNKGMPRYGDFCECPKGKGRVCDRNLLTQNVTLRLEDSGNTATFNVSEVKQAGKRDKNQKGSGLTKEMRTMGQSFKVTESQVINKEELIALEDDANSSKLKPTNRRNNNNQKNNNDRSRRRRGRQNKKKNNNK
ncbi:regulatory iron-sulfur-containing complex subunit RicT [Lentisphaerota bacterium WC36G]|nr:stage 0 sporulation protein [Lentisphaerae bacterium WC36]